MRLSLILSILVAVAVVISFVYSGNKVESANSDIKFDDLNVSSVVLKVMNTVFAHRMSVLCEKYKVNFPETYRNAKWMIYTAMKKNRQLSADDAMLIIFSIHKRAFEFGLPPMLVFVVIIWESGCNKNAVGTHNDQGLMQVVKGLHDSNNHYNLFDIDTNVLFGCRILADGVNSCGGNIRNALSVYNAGEINETGIGYSRGVYAFYLHTMSLAKSGKRASASLL